MTQETGRLLVVDDEEPNRDLLSRRLRKAGFELLYLLSFFAPIAFLLGYIAGAPRPVEQKSIWNELTQGYCPCRRSISTGMRPHSL